MRRFVRPFLTASIAVAAAGMLIAAPVNAAPATDPNPDQGIDDIIRGCNGDRQCIEEVLAKTVVPLPADDPAALCDQPAVCDRRNPNDALVGASNPNGLSIGAANQTPDSPGASDQHPGSPGPTNNNGNGPSGSKKNSP